jgi:DNA topoisomerase-2
MSAASSSALAAAGGAAAVAAAAANYKKLSHREHVLELPDTYIGSIETTQEARWVWNPEHAKMLWRTFAFNPGLYKVFDELVVNARDAFVRSRQTAGSTAVKHIDIEVGQTADGLRIVVENDGDGIPIEQHPTEGVMIPELIFGHLLTSNNYDKGEEKIVGGKNGYGAKLANIFSKRFVVDTRSPASAKHYTQVWTNNMSVCEKPSVRKATSSKGHVRIEFYPDTTRFIGGAFNTDGTLSPDMLAVLHTRTLELAAMVGIDVKVTWNGAACVVTSFEKYMKLFLKESAQTSSHVFEECGERWQVGAILTASLYVDDDSAATAASAAIPDERHVSFVNGILTKKGGKHVEYVARHVLGDFCEAASKKKVEVKPGQIKDAVVLFVNATIVNPAFDSQTKECLTTPATKFGSTPKFSGKLTTGLLKIGLLDEAKAILEAKNMREAKKTDGKKRTTLRGIPKLEDALWAGTDRSAECTLILTEGDSAATSAISGLSVVGRERWGVFPLKGKLLNVREISQAKFNANEELAAIKRILGLEHGKVYGVLKSLRYGRIQIMADQDNDGSHIKGLLMNFFHCEWPSLMRAGFLCCLLTPLLKASRGKEVVAFYTQAEYDTWREAGPGGERRGWTTKYYKGLGTSTPQEAKEWFRDLHQIVYSWDDATDTSMDLAFNKKKADERKTWLGTYDPKRTLAVTGGNGSASYSAFVHNELIHFSNADNIRSLPHIMDGLKPSQRKILYSCFKRNLRTEIRVAQLAGYVSEHAAYHHGEASLNQTIVGMAQNFVGANNLNYLQPIGQFGSRLLGGDDAASARYIHTALEPIVDVIFRKEDQVLLRWTEDDGERVEPEYYLPVIPMVAVNGCVGVGTGYSTKIPPYNPEQVVALLRARLEGGLETLRGRSLDPWWAGFKGSIVRTDERTWLTKGVWTCDDAAKTVTITELPIGMWTKNYKVFLDKLVQIEETTAASAKKTAAAAATAATAMKKTGGKGAVATAAAAAAAAAETHSIKSGGADDIADSFGLKAFDDLYTDSIIKFVLYFTEDGYDEVKANPSNFEKRFRLTTSWKTTNMCAFDCDFSIRRYDTVGDIMETFLERRLPAYDERKKHILAGLRQEITELEAKLVFIRAILDGRLVMTRKEDHEIVENLKACGVPPLSGQGAADLIESYDYVLRMRIDRVKASAVAALEAEAAEKRAKILEIEGKTPAQMWLEDLADFEVAWRRMCLARSEAAAETVSATGVTKIKVKVKPGSGGSCAKPKTGGKA